MSTAIRTCVLVFVTLRSGDPEAASALEVARRCLEGGDALASLRRMRCFELRGDLPELAELAERLHHSTQFYNPSKETVALHAGDPATSPFGPGEGGVLVFDRGGERRAAAERWWRHECGARIEVREGVAWAVRFASGDVTAGRLEGLAVSTSRAHGLFCNPHAQEWRALLPGEAPPPDWMSHKYTARRGTARGGTTS